MFTFLACINFANKTQWDTKKKFVQLITIKFLVFFIRKGKVVSQINDMDHGLKFVALFVERRHFVCDPMVCQD